MTTEANGLADGPADATLPSDQIIDLDTLQEAPQVDDDLEPAEPKPTEDEDKAKAEAEAKEKEEGEERKKNLSGAQKAKIREQKLRDEIAARDREIEELRKGTTKQAEQQASDDKDPQPKESDFTDWFEYQRKLAEWSGRQAGRDEVRKALEAREVSERSAREQQVRDERNQAHLERVAAAKEVIADFDQVMEKMRGVEIANAVIDEIKDSDKSAEITYHLALHPEKIDALNRMTPRELAREMGRLEATVSLPEPRKKTSAPPPPSKLTGGSTPRSPDSEIDAYLERTYGKHKR